VTDIAETLTLILLPAAILAPIFTLLARWLGPMFNRWMFRHYERKLDAIVEPGTQSHAARLQNVRTVFPEGGRSFRRHLAQYFAFLAVLGAAIEFARRAFPIS
jgi:hypothetical protein